MQIILNHNLSFFTMDISDVKNDTMQHIDTDQLIPQCFSRN